MGHARRKGASHPPKNAILAGSSWTLVSEVYTGSTSYSGIRALNATHVGVVINVGSVRGSSMACGAMTKFILVNVRTPQ